MKRYEKLSGAEIVALMDQCNKAHYDLADCPIGKGNLSVCPDDCLLTWLKSDVQLVPRWQTIKDQKHFIEMRNKFREQCIGDNCDDCIRSDQNWSGTYTYACFFNYLSEPVEKEVQE